MTLPLFPDLPHLPTDSAQESGQDKPARGTPRLNPDGYSVVGCSYIYAPRGQAGEYAPLSANPYRGCGHKCAYCLDGETLILMADGTSKPIKRIREGDEIFGVVKTGKNRSWNMRFSKTKVLATIKTRKTAYLINLSDGTTVICSEDHRWLTERGWKYTASTDQVRPHLTINSTIQKACDSTITQNEGGAVSDNAKVVSVTNLGYRIDMYDITTGTENFIANGMISHNCYVPDVLKMKREEFDAGAVERPNFLHNLEKDAKKYQALGITRQVMLSFTTDPFHPGDTTLTRKTIEIIKKYGLSFCTLTKGGSRALPFMDLFRPDRDAFASTLTSLDDTFSKKWERGAQLPGDRISTLRKFHDAGIFTWVSLEPTLDVESSLQIVRETHSFVDLFKVGRVNYLPMTKTTDWEDYTHRMIDLLGSLNAKHYIKHDLQKFLPEGYDNPKYIDQHN